MSVQVMGQTLLGLLLLVSLLVNASLLRLVKRGAALWGDVAAPLRAFLRWLPWVALLLTLGGLALAEGSLLTYHQAQNLDGLNWLVIGACLMIFANLCAAMVWLALREAVKITRSSLP